MRTARGVRTNGWGASSLYAACMLQLTNETNLKTQRRSAWNDYGGKKLVKSSLLRRMNRVCHRLDEEDS